MIHVFKQEKSIWSGEEKAGDIITSDIILRIESIVSAESLGDGRCMVLMCTGQTIVLKNTYDEVYGILLKTNN